MKNTKRMVSLCLILAMILSFGITSAFAAGDITVTFSTGETATIAAGEDLVFSLSCSAPVDLGPDPCVTASDPNVTITYSDVTTGGPNSYPTAETVTVSGITSAITLTIWYDSSVQDIPPALKLLSGTSGGAAAAATAATTAAAAPAGTAPADAAAPTDGAPTDGAPNMDASAGAPGADMGGMDALGQAQMMTGMGGDSAASSAKIYVSGGTLSTDAYDSASYTVAAGASGVTASGADGINMTSSLYESTGIVVTGGSTFALGGKTDYYTVNGKGYNSILNFLVGTAVASDATAGAGTAVDDGSTMFITNSYVQVDGAGRYAVSAYNDSTLVVNDSTVVVTGKSVNSNTDAISEPRSNAALLIAGNSRSNFSIGASKTYYFNSSCIAEGWAALSTDSATGDGLDLYAYNTYSEATNGGYGTYADTNCRVWLYGSDITGGELGAIISNNGKIVVADAASTPADVLKFNTGATTTQGSILAGGRNAIQIHSPDMMGSGASGAQTADFSVVNSTIKSDKSLITANALDYTATYGAAVGAYVDYISGAAILVKSTSANINLTNATIVSYNNTLVQTVLNSDSMGRFLSAGDNTKVNPIAVTMTSMTANGNILHQDYQRDMTVALSGTTLTGAIVQGTWADWTKTWSAYGAEAANWLPDATWTGTNSLSVTVDGTSTWNVSGTSTLSSLTIAPGATVNAGSMTVNGVKTAIAAGTYTGSIVLTAGTVSLPATSTVSAAPAGNLPQTGTTADSSIMMLVAAIFALTACAIVPVVVIKSKKAR